MMYMNVLTIVFASWNVAATTSSGLSAPGASVFLILNGSALVGFMAAGLAQLVSFNTSTANVAFECGWTAIFSLLQLGAGIAATVYGPAIQCQSGTTWGICTSSHLLVPVSWLSSFTVIAYFLMLFGTTMAHLHSYPLIWWNTVYSVPWFVSPTLNEPDTMTEPKPQSLSGPKTISASSDTRHGSFIAVRYLQHRFSSKIDDIEHISEPILFPPHSNGLHAVLPRNSLPGWAQKATTRRGLDMPFPMTEDITTPAEIVELSAPQPRIAQPRRGVDSPFATRVDGHTVPPAIYTEGSLQVPHFDTRPISPLQRKLTVSPAFSHKMEDQDSPIPLPKLSEWIRADSINGQSFRRQ